MNTTVLEWDRDLEEVCRALAHGEVVSPQLRERIDKEVARIREETRIKHGTSNIAVELIREARDGQ